MNLQGEGSTSITWAKAFFLKAWRKHVVSPSYQAVEKIVDILALFFLWSLKRRMILMTMPVTRPLEHLVDVQRGWRQKKR
jgi:hypothetical protein